MKKQILITVKVIISLLLAFFSVQCKKDNNSVVPNSTISWDTVYVDNFLKADGPLGNNYLVQVACSGNGTASISNNQLMFNGSGCWAIRDTASVPGTVIRVSICYVVENGNPSFGITIHNQKPTQTNMEFYAAFVGSNGIAICKYLPPSNTVDTLASKSITFQNTHTYKLQLVDNNKNLTAYINDLNAGTRDSIKFTDTGTSLTGTYVSLNGYNTGSTDEILFDNLIIEKGK